MFEVNARVFDSVLLADMDPGNRLLAGYCYHRPEVSDLFAHPPSEIPAPACRAHDAVDRSALAAALVAYQQQIGAAEAACEHARLLADPATPVITVGQQPGLLTGPLYTIYKAVTAVVLARRLAGEVGRPVVPVFWAATDDDDRREVDHVGLWDARYALHSLRYPDAAGAPGQLIGELPVQPYGEEVLAQTAQILAGMPFAGEVNGMLEATLADSADLGEWFCRLLANFCSGMGLVLCDPRLPALRHLGSEVLRREIVAPLRTTELVNRQARVLQQRGLPPALIKPPDTANFFLLNGTRRRVTYRNGCYHVGDEVLTPDDLLALLERTPERLLPNAVLRPLVQEYLFGSTAFVAGPNELGYWAELAPVFAGLEVAMPAVALRSGATLAPSLLTRRLSAWGVSLGELWLHGDRVRLVLLEHKQPPEVSQCFAGSRETLQHLTDELAAAVAQVDPTLAQSALAAQQRMLNEVERLERKMLKAVERQSGEHAGQLAETRELLFPAHGLQERTLNICSLLARHGMHFLQLLPELFAGQEGRHLFVEL